MQELHSPIVRQVKTINPSFRVYDITGDQTMFLAGTTSFSAPHTVEYSNSSPTSGSNVLTIGDEVGFYFTESGADTPNTYENVEIELSFSADQFTKTAGTVAASGHTIQDSTDDFTTRTNLKFLGGVTVTDNETDDATEIDIGGGHTIIDEDDAVVDQKDNLQFIGAATVANDGDNTVVTVGHSFENEDGSTAATRPTISLVGINAENETRWYSNHTYKYSYKRPIIIRHRYYSS